MPGYAPIAAAKGALESLVRYLAAELAAQGVNVNAIRPRLNFLSLSRKLN